jgi:hypothetical protein
MDMRRLHGISIIAAMMALSPHVVHAQTVSAVWDPNPPADQLTGYQVCIGTSSMTCNVQQASVAPTETSYTFAPSAGVLYRVAVRAVSAEGAGTYSSEVVTSIPSLTQPANQSSPVNVAIAPVSLTANDPDGGTLRFSHTGLPFGLSLNQNTGIITGTPSSPGTFNVTVFVFDGLATVSRAFTWTVNPPTASAGPVSPNSGTGSTQTFSAQFSDTAGATNLAYVYLRFSTTATGATNTCMVRYDRAAARLSLRNDAGNWLAGAAIPSGTTQQNTQCSISFAASSVSLSGQTLTLNVAVTFKPAYAGAKNIYSYAQSMNGAVTDWVARGTWTVPTSSAPPGLTVGTVTPNGGSGSAQTFSAQYTDAAGVNDIATVYLRFSNSPNGPNNICMVMYNRATARLSLRDNNGTWLAGLPIPSSATQQNSQCSIHFANSSASASGQTLTLNVAVTFASAYAGAKNIYGYATTVGGTNTDWQLRGTWTITTTPVTPSLTADTVTPNSGSGTSQTFSAQFTDTLGMSDIAYVYFRVSAALNGPLNVCMVRYSPSTGAMSLRENNSQWMPARTFAQGGTQTNSQCSVNFAASSATVNGTTLTLNVAYTFNTAYAGAKNIYLYAQSVSGFVTEWQTRGTWIVP